MKVMATKGKDAGNDTGLRKGTSVCSRAAATGTCRAARRLQILVQGKL